MSIRENVYNAELVQKAKPGDFEGVRFAESHIHGYQQIEAVKNRLLRNISYTCLRKRAVLISSCLVLFKSFAIVAH